ncbi:MAG: hypothetical protein ACI360_08655 [Atopobiaceae bacterium]
MKYLVIISQGRPDGSDTPAMTAYDDYQKAVSAFHMELAYGAISDQLSSDMAMLADTTGRVYETAIVQGLAKPVEAPKSDSATGNTSSTSEAATTTTTGSTGAGTGDTTATTDAAAPAAAE